MTSLPPSVKKVAVCLAACNGAPWLNEQLDSILRQEGVLVQVFISVDASTDETYRLVTERAATCALISVLPQERTFGSAALNFFHLLGELDFSGFDYVSLADQDDRWYSDKLLRAVRHLSEQNTDCYSSNVRAVWDDGRSVVIDKAQPLCSWDFLFEAAGPGCTYVFTRSFAQSLQSLLRNTPIPIQANIGVHDWFIYAFARASGFSWFIDPVPSMDYRQHGGNLIGANRGGAAFAHRVRTVLSGWAIRQARQMARLVKVDSRAFCRPWSRPGRLGMLFLAMNSHRARRRIPDKFFFALACLLLAIVGDRSGA